MNTFLLSAAFTLAAGLSALPGAALSEQDPGRAAGPDAVNPYEVIERIFGHAGKVMEMPNDDRLVLYLPLDQVLHMSPDGSVSGAANVVINHAPDFEIILVWQDGETNLVSPDDTAGIAYLDEVPLIVSQMDRVVGKVLRTPVDLLPSGAELGELGAVLTADGVIGEWGLSRDAVYVRLQGTETRLIDPQNLVAAVTSSDDVTAAAGKDG